MYKICHLCLDCGPCRRMGGRNRAFQNGADGEFALGVYVLIEGGSNSGTGSELSGLWQAVHYAG